jgi:hypothetical protein
MMRINIFKEILVVHSNASHFIFIQKYLQANSQNFFLTPSNCDSRFQNNNKKSQSVFYNVHQLRAAIMFIPQAKFQSMGSKMKYGL